MHKLLRKFLSGLRHYHNKHTEHFVQTRAKDLQKLEFVHSVYFGEAAHDCADWKSQDRRFRSDAPVAILITRQGKVSGVIGFEILRSTILVRQLQGAPRGNYHDGTKVEEYLLTCAEVIARQLKMRVLRVIDAETALEFR